MYEEFEPECVFGWCLACLTGCVLYEEADSESAVAVLHRATVQLDVQVTML